MKQSKDEFTCVQEDCYQKNERYAIDPAAGSHYCPYHKCAKVCKSKRLFRDGVWYPNCERHSCREGQCNRSLLKGKAHYCVEHCCDVDNCIEKADVNGLCKAHSLNTDTQPCAVRDCSASSKHTFCSKHRCAYFAGKACEKIADNVEFCPRHRCSLPDCTTRLPRFHDDGNYCKAHTCAEKDCRSRVNGGNFCELHACKVGGCRSAATTDNYCTSHQRCQKPACQSARRKGAFCLSHACRVDFCDRAACTVNGYCEEIHACLTPGCENIRARSVDSRYKHDMCVDCGAWNRS